MISVLLADDDHLMRAGVRLILNQASDIAVVAEASDGASALVKAREEKPDVVLMDIRMPGTDGIEATKELTEGGPWPRVIMLTTFDVDEYVFASLRAGASGFLLKRAEPAALIEGIRTVARGDGLLSPAVTKRLIEEFTASLPRPTEMERRIQPLTAREQEVLMHLGRGLSNLEMSEQLFITENTVKTHIKRVLSKIEARDRVHAVVIAYESGLMDDGRSRDI
ncbi:MAG: response regulator transcription factor [Hyphomicrobiales bacterium]|nr:response regulator transcription factor [Hyphomicrobiales bacterium]